MVGGAAFGKLAGSGPRGANNPHGCKGRPEEDETINNDNIMVDSSTPDPAPAKAEQGTSTGYVVCRLARDRPIPLIWNNKNLLVIISVI
jgi:hypothetical protein